ncbi:MAG: gamma-glutamyltransferase [Chitinophagaceae bacterium]|nr:gamma-glutamyltransferase [Chitinophagaceae bacterium]
MIKKYLIGFIVCYLGIANLVAQPKNNNWVGAGKYVDPYHYVQVKSATFKNGAVSSAHPLASMVGATTMKQGGNAFDAAIAVQLTLAVVYPGAGNIGGGGFLVARKKTGQLIGLDYRETAPAQASKNMYLDKDGQAQTTLSQNGHLAAGVPGTIAGLFQTKKYARLPFRQLIQPAIDLAEFGFVITEREANNLNSNQAAFIKYNTSNPAFVKGTKWKAGDTLVQKDLANTLKRIRDNGAKGFYEGITANMIVGEMKKGNGIISLEDLRSYKVKTRTPLQIDYKGYKVIGFPPPSSGGIILLQVMKMVEKYPMKAYGFQKQQSTQLMIEAERRAYADRAEHLGDPDFWKVPLKTMSSNAYIQNRMKDYDPSRASLSSQIKAGEIKESEETTHLSIYDSEGNMVSVTTTLNGGYGSKTVVAGAGFLLNNEMDDFSIKPGVANMYGAVGGAANAIQPGKRMLSSMCPVVVLKNNKPYIVAGTPGGTTIPTSVFQTLMNLLEFNMSVEDAVNKPKFHHPHLPDQVEVEKGFPLETRKQLELMGYKIVDRGAWSRTEVIRINAKGNIEVAADKRGDDSVAGY